MVINVDSIIDIQDDLNTRSLITYNGVPYSILFTLTSYPSFILILGWNGEHKLKQSNRCVFKQLFFLLDKPGVFKQLKVEGSFTIDDSTVMSVTHIMNNEETASVGTVGKSLKRDSWWETENQIDSDQWNLVWVCALSENNLGHEKSTLLLLYCVLEIVKKRIHRKIYYGQQQYKKYKCGDKKSTYSTYT